MFCPVSLLWPWICLPLSVFFACKNNHLQEAAVDGIEARPCLHNLGNWFVQHSNKLYYWRMQRQRRFSYCSFRIELMCQKSSWTVSTGYRSEKNHNTKPTNTPLWTIMLPYRVAGRWIGTTNRFNERIIRKNEKIMKVWVVHQQDTRVDVTKTAAGFRAVASRW